MPKSENAVFTPKVIRSITLPLIKPQLDVPVYVKITGALFEGKKVEGTSDASKMEPATLFNCIDLVTGELAQMIAPAVLKSILAEEYPDDSYIGLGFGITKHPKVSGKRYHTFTVQQIEV